MECVLHADDACMKLKCKCIDSKCSVLFWFFVIIIVCFWGKIITVVIIMILQVFVGE